MNADDKINLQNILQQSDAEETTDKIRNLKHSQKIKEDVTRMIELKTKYARLRTSNADQFESMCISQCNFLFTTYTNIYNKLYKDELDLNILANFIDVLKRIEDGEIDQHEGSYLVGQLLKKIYVDSAIKHSENVDKKNAKHTKTSSKPVKKPKKLSWAEYKKMDTNEVTA